EFLLGKQLPYVALAMVNFLLMSLLAVTVFGVPITGSFFALALAALVFSFVATGMGLLASSITRSQIAAMFFAMIGTMVPATQFSGLIDPVSSLEGAGQLIGQVYPATHMVTISRGVFSKALGLAELSGAFWAMLLSVPVIMGLAVMLLKHQGLCGEQANAGQYLPPRGQGTVEPVARRDDAGTHHLGVHRGRVHRRQRHAGNPQPGTHRGGRRG